MAQTKAQLRAEILAARPRSSAGITERLVALAQGHQLIASYSPLASEPDVSEFNDWVVKAGKTLLLPKIIGETLEWREPAAVEKGRFSIASPTGERHDILRAGLLVIPALAVDARGVRLGRGGGYYDRALVQLRKDQMTVAVVFDGELLPELPVEAHDVAVKIAVTPAATKHF